MLVFLHSLYRSWFSISLKWFLSLVNRWPRTSSRWPACPCCVSLVTFSLSFLRLTSLLNKADFPLMWKNMYTLVLSEICGMLFLKACRISWPNSVFYGMFGSVIGSGSFPIFCFLFDWESLFFWALFLCLFIVSRYCTARNRRVLSLPWVKSTDILSVLLDKRWGTWHRERIAHDMFAGELAAWGRGGASNLWCW